MEILESLEARLPETGELQRVVISGPETGARHVSAVLVRVPPGHEFPLHTHPASEDCFFVVSGAGEACEPGRRLPIAARAVVWIPAGHPHGLIAGPEGVLEVGFQSPPDPTVVPFEPRGTARPSPALVAASVSLNAAPGDRRPQWLPVFRLRRQRRRLDPYYATLRASESLLAEARGFELVVVVACGAAELPGAARRRVDAVGALHLGPGAAVEVRALASPTLLLGIRAT